MVPRVVPRQGKNVTAPRTQGVSRCWGMVRKRTFNYGIVEKDWVCPLYLDLFVLVNTTAASRSFWLQLPQHDGISVEVDQADSP